MAERDLRYILTYSLLLTLIDSSDSSFVIHKQDIGIFLDMFILNSFRTSKWFDILLFLLVVSGLSLVKR